MYSFIKIFLIISIIMSGPAKAQTWKELMDSTQAFLNKGLYQTSLNFALQAEKMAEKEFGTLDTNYASTLDKIAEIFFFSRNYPSTYEYEEKALSIFRNIFKTDHPLLAKSIANMASIYSATGKYDKAEPLLKEALEMRRRIFKGDHPDLAESIDNMASFNNKEEKHELAETLFKESLEMKRRIFKGDHPDLAYSINMMSSFYQDNSKYKEAEIFSKEALEMYRRLYKYGHPDLAGSIYRLAKLFGEIGKIEDADSLFRESIEMYEHFSKEGNQSLAFILSDVAQFYNTIGKYKEAEHLLIKSIQMLKNIFKGDNGHIVVSLGYLGNSIYLQCRYREAEPFYKESYEMSRRLFSKDNANLAVSINNMARFYHSTGKYTEAEQLYKESLDMNRRIFKSDNINLVIFINNLSVFYNSLGKYAEAEPLLKEAIQISRRLFKGDHPETATNIYNLGQFYSEIGRDSEAESLLKESISINSRIFGNEHQHTLGFKVALASFYTVRERYTEAEPLFIELSEIFKRNNETDNIEKASLFQCLGRYYRDLAQYDKAEAMFKQGLEMNRRIFKNDNSSIAGCLNELAILYLRKGDINLVEPLLIEAYNMRKQIYHSDHPNLAIGLINLSSIYDIQGKKSEAEQKMIEAIKMNTNLINNYYPSLSEIEKKQYWNTVSIDYEHFNTFASKKSKGNPNFISFMYDNQLFTKALLLNSSNRVKSRIMNSGDSLLISKYRTWSDIKGFLVNLYKMTNEELKKKNFRIDSIENVANEIEKELTLKSEAFKQSFEKKKVTWKSIQTLLKPDEAAVEVIRFRYKDINRFTDTIHYAFLIINEKTEEHPELVLIENGKELENEFYNEYRENISKKTGDKKSFERYWAKLYEKIKDYKKVYFSADGIYNKLNPSTFMLPNGKYLLDFQDIQQVNSTKDLLIGYYKKQDESNIFNSALLIGNPNFSLSDEEVKLASRKFRGNKEEEKSYEQLASTRGIKLTRLPGTEKEINNIEKFLKEKLWKVNTYLGDNALKTAIKTANNPRVLHIATHGLFLEDVKRDSKDLFGFEEQKMIENPLLRSGLFFTGADNYLKKEHSNLSDEEDNGLLTAYEAMNLDLDKTELVVLSACETGLGEIQNGEGVFGLRRAFQQAGARSVLMSLWKVNDEATQELMSSFYKNWVTGLTKRDAFSKAQQEIRNKYKDPYYWGAFVMVGE